MGSDNNDKMKTKGNHCHNSGLCFKLPATDEFGLERRRRWWRYHVMLCSVVLWMGMMRNGGQRKYIRANASKVSAAYGKLYNSQGICDKAFVNVHAISQADKDAIFCCNNRNNNSNNNINNNNNTAAIEDLLCQRRHRLPLSDTLHTFFTSWLLPLVPQFLRTLMLILHKWQLPQQQQQQPQQYQILTYLKLWLGPLLFYLLLMTFRAFVLYAYFDKLEQELLGLHQKQQERECWYRPLLSDRHLDDAIVCPRRDYDFSDHAVLFLGQMLPVVTLELLFLHHDYLEQQKQHLLQRSRPAVVLLSRRVSLLLATAALGVSFYLYLLCLDALYRTAAVFHTVLESMGGYVIALIFVHWPLYVYVVGAK